MTIAEAPANPLAALVHPDVRADPYPLYTMLREQGPLLTADGALAAFASYKDCRAVLHHPAMSSRPTLEPPSGEPESFIFLDAPDHTRLRTLVTKAFTPRAVAGLAARITEIVDATLDAALDRGGMELVEELAAPLPIVIISEWLGVPTEDSLLMRGLTEKITLGLDPVGAGDASVALAGHEASVELSDYFSALIADRSRREDTDLLSRLLHVEEQGDRLSIGELLVTIGSLLVAGHETTTGLITNGILALSRNPAEFDRLRADASLADRAVEETLRYDAPAQLTQRMATEDTVIGGIEVPRGCLVLPLLAAANRDPELHRDPDVFSLARTDTTHLAFSAGPHFCVGAGLARLEASIVFSRFAERVTRLEADESSLRYRPHVNLRGPARLSLAF